MSLHRLSKPQRQGAKLHEYEQRQRRDCAEFAPSSCAYRLLFEGKSLPAWHHLVTQDNDTIHQQGQSVRQRVRSQSEINSDDIEDYVVDWP